MGKNDSKKLPLQQLKRIRILLQVIDELKEVPKDHAHLVALRPHSLKGQWEDSSSRANFSNILNGKASISTLMALKFKFNFGGAVRSWIQLQATYDLEIARKRDSMRNWKLPDVAADVLNWIR